MVSVFSYQKCLYKNVTLFVPEKSQNSNRNEFLFCSLSTVIRVHLFDGHVEHVLYNYPNYGIKSALCCKSGERVRISYQYSQGP